jgi:hypothetical protein
MKRLPCALVLAAATAITVFAADRPATPVSKVFDNDLKNIENELVPLAEAMPADKYSFAPTHGEFKGVRTFAQQATHVAAVLYVVSAAVLGEKNPSEMGADENGPANLKTKDDIVMYLKAAFAYGHKAMNSVTVQNMMDPVPVPWSKNGVPRASMATEATAHSFDHYGQMVVYLRMNGIIPPASRRSTPQRPPATSR